MTSEAGSATRDRLSISIRGVPHGRRRHGHESKRGTVDAEAPEESADRGQRQRDRVGRELTGAPIAEPGLDALLLQHAVPHAGIDPGQHEARSIGPEIQERKELGHRPSVAKGAMIDLDPAGGGSLDDRHRPIVATLDLEAGEVRAGAPYGLPGEVVLGKGLSEQKTQ